MSNLDCSCGATCSQVEALQEKNEKLNARLKVLQDAEVMASGNDDMKMIWVNSAEMQRALWGSK
jgi:hypothetical protein